MHNARSWPRLQQSATQHGTYVEALQTLNDRSSRALVCFFCSVHSPTFAHLYGSWCGLRSLRPRCREFGGLRARRVLVVQKIDV